MGAGSTRDFGRIAMIGNSPPRRCGIATFTDHIRAALASAYPDLGIDIYAMNDGGNRYDYPADVVCTIEQDDLPDYAAAAHRINESGADVVCVQHEYGIFGGAAGAHLVKLLDRVRAPVVVTLHTVLEQPDAHQRAVIDALARRAAKLVVMAEKGRELLAAVHGIATDRIAVIPHGVPDRPLSDGVREKARFGFAGRRVLLTFGLLSPGKGIETMVRAMPEVVAAHPDALYVVLGATHPHLVAREGEAYREQLGALAAELGVSDNVCLIDTYADEETLLDYLAAADIYVTPYRNIAQITSGTLSYAVALGRPVVSTPYWHAAELVGDRLGRLVAPGDSAAFAEAINALLADPATLAALSRTVWEAGRSMIWPETARAYVELFEEALASQPARLFRGPERATDGIVGPRLGSVERLTDRTGMIQHSIFSVPDRNHGYCVDDNCRALMLMHRIGGADAARADELALTYAAFVQHAWNGEIGRFRNFMGFDRGWLEREGSEDSFGRSLWSLGDTAHRARRHDLRVWASHLFDQVAPHAFRFRSLRTKAFVILGADAMIDAHPGHEPATTLVRELAAELVAEYAGARRPGWDWFESVLAYDNARLPQALLVAGRRLGAPALVQAGLETLAWLDARQTSPLGLFRAVGTDSFGREHADPLPFDQQPLEAWATIEAARDAHAITHDVRWEATARCAYAWYMGANDLGTPIGVVEDGGCFDGLMADRVNQNQGAESVLAFQFACCAIGEMTEKAGRNGGTPPADALAS